MSTTKRPTPIKGTSGEHPAVVDFLEKTESFEGEIEKMNRIRERLARISRRPMPGSDRPPRAEDMAAMVTPRAPTIPDPPLVPKPPATAPDVDGEPAK